MPGFSFPFSKIHDERETTTDAAGKKAFFVPYYTALLVLLASVSADTVQYVIDRGSLKRKLDTNLIASLNRFFNLLFHVRLVFGYL